jgi:hypothetical protein
VNADPRSGANALPHPPPTLQPPRHPVLSPVWIPSRHFTERAAPVSRAPSPTLA